MAKKHIHKYHKINIAAGKLWACALSDCNHYMPKHLEGVLIGKRSICWNCGEEFVLDENNMTIDRPICSDCKPNKVLNALEHFGISID